MSSVLRVDQLGSLLRPPALREAAIGQMRGGVADDELQALQDQAVREVIAAQEAHGFPILTDGEFRRRNFVDSVATSVTGMEAWRDGWARRFLAEIDQRANPGFTAPPPQVADAQPATGRLAFVRNTPLEEWRRSSALTRRPVKITVLDPLRVAQCIDVAASHGIYDDLDQVLMDAAAAIREIVIGLRDAGCPYVQLDAPGYTAFLDADRRAALEARGANIAAMLEQVIRAENAAVAGIDGLTIGIHICRGNRPNAKWGTGPYDAIAEQLFPAVARAGCSWSTTRSAPAALSRCALSRRARWPSWAWSAPSPPRWRPWTRSDAGWTTRLASSRWSSWPSARNAASRRTSPGRRSRRTRSGASSTRSPRRHGSSGGDTSWLTTPGPCP